jgi:hypothetical protein
MILYHCRLPTTLKEPDVDGGSSHNILCLLILMRSRMINILNGGRITAWIESPETDGSEPDSSFKYAESIRP